MKPSLILFLTLFVALSNSASLNADFEKNEHYLAHEKMISEINSDKQSTFEAFHYDRFKGLSLEQLKQFTGVIVSDEDLERAKQNSLKNRDEDGAVGADELPTNFNVWDKWPKCKDVFQTIQDQATCGSCYGVATASALTDRKCIKSDGKDKTQLSSWDIVSCCSECQADKSDGCKGGFVDKVYKFYKFTGVVSGDKYGGENCIPYPVKPAEKPPKDYPVAIKFLSSVGVLNLGVKADKCEKTCQSSYKTNSYAKDKKAGGGYRTYNNDEQGVMKEIYKNGPVTAAFKAYQDLFAYKFGVYSHQKGDYAGGHLVKVVGWGVQNGVKYWNVVNSWNTTWGDQGYFKMIRGTNNCAFETFMMGGNLDASEKQDPDDNNNEKQGSDSFGFSNMYANGFLIALLLKLALY